MTNKNKSKRHMNICFALLCILLLLLFFPFNLEIAPGRTLKIVGSNGQVFKDIKVRRIYYQYSLEKHGEVDLYVDARGEVKLPQRQVKTSIFSLLIGALKQIREVGIHASFKSSETIAIFSKDYPTKWFYGGKGLESGTLIIGN